MLLIAIRTSTKPVPLALVLRYLFRICVEISPLKMIIIFHLE